MNKLRIRVINTGIVRNLAKSAVNYLDSYEQKVANIYPMFLIEGGEQKILVDTGNGDPERILKYHGHHLERKPEEDPLVALRKAGVTPDDIPIVINTHLHYDHCYNNHLFPKAKILVQRKELAYAISPAPTQNVVYEIGIAGVTPPWIKSLNNMVAVEGEVDVIPGVRLIPLPGHSPGLQGVLVDTEKGKYLLASDLVYFYQNLRCNNLVKDIVPTQHIDVETCLKSLALAQRIADVVLPGHDPELLKQEFYPY